MDHKHFEKAASKILDVFSDERITHHDLMYVALYTVTNAYPKSVLEKIIDFSNHVDYERERLRSTPGYDRLGQ